MRKKDENEMVEKQTFLKGGNVPAFPARHAVFNAAPAAPRGGSPLSGRAARLENSGDQDGPEPRRSVIWVDTASVGAV